VPPDDGAVGFDIHDAEPRCLGDDVHPSTIGDDLSAVGSSRGLDVGLPSAPGDDGCDPLGSRRDRDRGKPGRVGSARSLFLAP
jgi:hypothetical protein